MDLDRRLRPSILSAIALLSILWLALSAPANVMACQCMGREEGDVVFTGTVTDSPNELSLLHDVFLANSGVYTFDVESVQRGEAFDGRVHSGGRTCESAYQVGATYRVHAGYVPDESGEGNSAGVSLAIGPCMVAPELLAPQTPLTAFPYWALSSGGVLALSAGALGLVIGIAAFAYWRADRDVRQPD